MAGPGAPAVARTGLPAGPRATRDRRTWIGVGQGPLPPVLTTIAFLALWELAARAGILPEELPPFTDVIDWLGQNITGNAFLLALSDTVQHWLLGLAIGAGAGLVVGITIGAVPLLARLFQVPFELLRPIPAVVYLPLLLLVMGARGEVAMLLAAVGAFWPMLFQTYYGVGAVDPLSLDTGRVFGLSAWQRLRYIIVRSVMPYVATGLRISSSLALVVAISTELIGAVPGIGRDLGTYASNAVYPGVYGLILVTGVLGVIANALLRTVEKRMLVWHASNRMGTVE